MAINRSNKRWVLATILLLLFILFFDWLASRHRANEKLKYENIRHGINK
jgi:hypothetical protein